MAEGSSISEQERQMRVNEKVGAISNNPGENRSTREIKEQAEDEVDKGLVVWGVVDAGSKWYSVDGESRETMEAWKTQLEQILENAKMAIESQNFSSLSEIMGDDFIESDLAGIVEKLHHEANEYGQVIDDEAMKLLSIGLWLWREQGGAWAGERKIIWKMLTKDSAKLSSFLEEKGAPSCIDTSFLVKALADQLDIHGDVQKIGEGKLAHRYFQTDSGKIMDYWWSRGTAGLKLNKDAFAKVKVGKSSNCSFDT